MSNPLLDAANMSVESEDSVTTRFTHPMLREYFIGDLVEVAFTGVETNYWPRGKIKNFDVGSNTLYLGVDGNTKFTIDLAKVLFIKKV